MSKQFTSRSGYRSYHGIEELSTMRKSSSISPSVAYMNEKCRFISSVFYNEWRCLLTICKLLYNFQTLTHLTVKSGSTYLRVCVSMIDPFALCLTMISMKSIDTTRNVISPMRYTRTKSPPDEQLHVRS